MAKSYDISALGTTVALTFHPYKSSGVKKTIIINDFPTLGNPVRIEDGETGSLEMDVNGASYRQASLRPITVSLSLIPRSDSEKALNDICIKNFGIAYNRVDLTVHYRSNFEHEDPFDVNFTGGIIRNVKKGYIFVGEGRLETMVYAFQFPPPLT